MINLQFRSSPQLGLSFEPIWVDNFCGGGGASTGIESAIGRSVDIAINHDEQAISMHTVNHPTTKHYHESVWDIDPVKVCAGRPVAGGWFSPDCRHFSKAKGKTPVQKNIRGLAWVMIRWALEVGPDELYLENVAEFQTWGPLNYDEKGHAHPCPERKSETFKAFIHILSTGIETDHPGYLDCLDALSIKPGTDKAARLADGLGYTVDWRELKACDYGVPTIRKRLYLVAKRHGRKIIWPKPTHGPGLKPYKTAADIIDWSIPCPSIFERKKPLADKTLARIAKGIQRFVIDSADPFIVRIGHAGWGGNGMQYSIKEPLTTITSKAEHCLVVPVIDRQFGSSGCNSVTDPLGTVTSGDGGKSALVAAFVAKHFGGMTGVKLKTPFPTITAKGCQNQIVTSHLIKLRGTCKDGQSVEEPLPTITAGGLHIGEVRAFLLKYYGTGEGCSIKEPVHTVTTKDRFGLVTIRGEEYQIVDIGMRMLEPHELFAAQGFPKNYIFDRDKDGKKITKTQQVAKCGNSVCPPMAEAIVRANKDDAATSLAA